MDGKMLSELIRELQEIYNKNGDMMCVYAEDDEGNSYGKLYYEPSVKYWDNFYGEIIEEDEIEQDEVDSYAKVVCIN